MHSEENHLDATEWFIALITCSTCFGHLYAHYQELETTICYYRIWCVMPWLLVVGDQVQGSRLCVRDGGSCSSSFPHPWWWAYKCPKHVEQIVSAINHSVASSWFSSLRTQVLLCLAMLSGRLWTDAYEYVALVEWWPTEKPRSTWKETGPSAAYSITNPKWTSLWSNPDLWVVFAIVLKLRHSLRSLVLRIRIQILCYLYRALWYNHVI